MKKRTLIMLAVASLVASTQANLVSNGDFENPDITGTAVTDPITDWTKAQRTSRLDQDVIGPLSGGNLLPGNFGGVTNQALRMGGNLQYRLTQGLVHNWAADDSFTLNFNASEVWWRAGGTGDDLTISIFETVSGTLLWDTGLILLADTHLGDVGEANNLDWAANQTFSYSFDPGDFTTGTEGSAITIELKSHGVVWADNVSLAIPEPATLGMVAAFGGGILFIRRKLMM